jgi:hypothetical protein
VTAFAVDWKHAKAVLMTVSAQHAAIERVMAQKHVVHARATASAVVTAFALPHVAVTGIARLANHARVVRLIVTHARRSAAMGCAAVEKPAYHVRPIAVERSVQMLRHLRLWESRALGDVGFVVRAPTVPTKYTSPNLQEATARIHSTLDRCAYPSETQRSGVAVPVLKDTTSQTEVLTQERAFRPQVVAMEVRTTTACRILLQPPLELDSGHADRARHATRVRQDIIKHSLQ